MNTQQKGSARLQICRDGGICGSKHCSQYPPHGELYRNGMAEPLAPMTFSLTRMALAGVRGLLTAGLTACEMVGVCATLHQSGFIDNEQTDRADRLYQYYTASGEGVPEAVYNALFCPDEDARPPVFAAHGDHLHLVALGMMDNSGIRSEYGAKKAIALAFERGFVSREGRVNLLASIPNLTLPETDENDGWGVIIINPDDPSHPEEK